MLILRLALHALGTDFAQDQLQQRPLPLPALSQLTLPVSLGLLQQLIQKLVTRQPCSLVRTASTKQPATSAGHAEKQLANAYLSDPESCPTDLAVPVLLASSQLVPAGSACEQVDGRTQPVGDIWQRSLGYILISLKPKMP